MSDPITYAEVTPADLDPRYELTLQCGDTISSNSASKLGAYRLCIHCDGTRRVISVTDTHTPPAATDAELGNAQEYRALWLQAVAEQDALEFEAEAVELAHTSITQRMKDTRAAANRSSDATWEARRQYVSCLRAAGLVDTASGPMLPGEAAALGGYRPMSTDPVTGAKVVTPEDVRAQTGKHRQS